MTIQVSPNQSSNQPVEMTRLDDRTTYLTHLLNLRSDLVPSLLPDTQAWLQEVRDRAAIHLQELAIPSTRDEDWRFTDLSRLMRINVQPSPGLLVSSLDAIAITPFILPEAGDRLVFVDGIFAPHLSACSATQVMYGNLVGTQQDTVLNVRLRDRLGKQQGAEEVFTTLNTASFHDAAVIHVPRNLVVNAPIHLLFISTGGNTPIAVHPRCWLVAEANSSISLVEDYIALDRGVYFTNAVTEFWLEENAQVIHTRIQRDSQTSIHIGKTAVSQARTSRYTCNAISMGAALSRHNLEIYQTGEQTETTLNGLTMIGAEQVADTHSAIALTKPYGTTRQLHKCIVDDRAHAIFNGKVLVPKAAQLTDAGQLNRNLLLSPKARVDTKPQLEIVADNVKCTHGATVSQLDADEVFYLQSRGIDAVSAQVLLVYAFAFEIIDKLPVESLRQALIRQVRPQNKD